MTHSDPLLVAQVSCSADGMGHSSVHHDAFWSKHSTAGFHKTDKSGAQVLGLDTAVLMSFDEWLVRASLLALSEMDCNTALSKVSP